MQTRDQSKRVLYLLEKEVNKPESEQNKDLINACRTLVYRNVRDVSDEYNSRTDDELTKEVFLDYKNDGYRDKDIARIFNITDDKMHYIKKSWGLSGKNCEVIYY